MHGDMCLHAWDHMPACSWTHACNLLLVLCCRICGEYEQFRLKALKVPEDSREMMEQMAYMEEVKVDLVRKQWEAVQESLRCLTYLLDIHTFTPEEMEQNKVTLTWPKKLAPIFEENEEVMVASKVAPHSMAMYVHACDCSAGEGGERTDRETGEGDHRSGEVSSRVEEFSEYSDLTIMQQYCKEITL